ncbi:MAG: MBL fold metallo-hydrolase [Candidatus Woesearchaeota archaeon]
MNKNPTEKKLAKVKIIVPGYIMHGSGIVCSTCTLIKSEGKNIIVDPGTTKNQRIIIDALKKEGLTLRDIHVVCITHSHLDHYRNIGMFENAKSLDYWGLWSKDKLSFNTKERQFNKDIRVLRTPGHSYDGITLLVKTDTGIVAICGDIFWKKDYPKKDVYAFDAKQLEKDRTMLKKVADYIIPGHGKMFRTR